MVGFNEEVEKHEPSDVSSYNEAKENVDDSSQEAVDHANGRELDRYGIYDKIEIIEDDCCDGLGFSFPPVRNGPSSPSSSSSRSR